MAPDRERAARSVLSADARRPTTARGRDRGLDATRIRRRSPAQSRGVSAMSPSPSASLPSLWRQLIRGIRALTRSSAADQDVADEVQHYLDQATAAHRARGLSRADAVRAARLELGNVTGVREQVRDYGWENVVESFLADLRYAARRLRATPGF